MVTVVGLLTSSPNLPQKLPKKKEPWEWVKWKTERVYLLSINLAMALRPGFLAMRLISSGIPSRSW